MKVYVATYVDIGENTDGKAMVLGIYKTKALANDSIIEDMNKMSKNCNGLKFDYIRMSALNDDNFGCEWNISEIEVDANDLTNKGNML